jgi:multicomponent Na+:H+ antiporter subunit G
MIIGFSFIFLGIIGLFRFKNFYSRILITSKIEILGFLTLMIGLMLYTGLSTSTLKIFIITVLVIITNPLSTHAIARSAYKSGHPIKKENH